MRMTWRTGALALAGSVAAQAGLLALPQQASKILIFLEIGTAVWSGWQFSSLARRDRRSGAASSCGPDVLRLGRGLRLLIMALAGWSLARALEVVLPLVDPAAPAPGSALPAVPVSLTSALAMGLAVAAELAFPSAPLTVAGKVRMLLDGVVAALAIAGVVAAVAGQLTLPRDARGISLLIMMLSMTVMVAVGLLVVSRGRAPGVRLLTGGITLGSTAVVAKELTSLTGSSLPVDGGAIVLATLMIGLAARLPMRTAAVRAAAPPSAWVTLMPYLPVVPLVVISVREVLINGGVGRLPALIDLLVIVVVFARQFLTLRMNAALTAELAGQREALAHQAHHDPLTGLANREMFTQRLAEAIATGRSGPALLLVDLDGFKAVNDTRGHTVGDAVLIAVARRLADCVRSEDLVARLGGDEFGVLLPDMDDQATVLSVASRMLREVSRPLRLDDGQVTVNVSIGIAVGDGHAVPNLLLRDADLALNRAKVEGRNRCWLADAALSYGAVDRMRLEEDLRHAVGRHELEVYYQPIVAMSDCRLLGLEALVRWQHPERGLLQPGAFVPIAESSGLLPALDRWVLADACRMLARWRRVVPELYVSVNACAGQFADPSFPARVAESLRLAGLPPRALTIELTESALVADVGTAGRILQEISELGVRLALDDFGTGYSSLAYLRSMPIDVIKIDRSFVRELGGHAADDVVIRAVVGLAEALNLTVVAEGVETEFQLAELRRLRCARGQGYLFGKPMPAEQVAALLPARAMGEPVTGPVLGVAAPTARVTAGSGPGWPGT
jgi:diguanylate cyclase (GGDEF)-like protein